MNEWLKDLAYCIDNRLQANYNLISSKNEAIRKAELLQVLQYE
ncbi:hypothetical protein [Chryseobacterium hagamense]|nr:hypothetical protein [Chryseobacterium hagamense]